MALACGHRRTNRMMIEGGPVHSQTANWIDSYERTAYLQFGSKALPVKRKGIKVTTFPLFRDIQPRLLNMKFLACRHDYQRQIVLRLRSAFLGCMFVVPALAVPSENDQA